MTRSRTIAPPRAPTEAEIRTAYHGRDLPRYEPIWRLVDELKDVVTQFTDPFAWAGLGDDATGGSETGNALWTDLRPSEARELETLLRLAQERAMRAALEAIENEIVEACLLFAERHPDVPRTPAP